MCRSEECFVNLHLHTAYSLLDGMSRPEDVVKKVKSMNQRGFATTEHGNVHSSVKMYKLAKENDLKFIYGCEFYICGNRFEKDKNNKYYHLTVLAKNEQGRININKLVSLGFLEGFYHKPRIDFDLLSQHSEGLIILSGCMASELQQTLAGGKIKNGGVEIYSGNIERAKEVAIRYRKVFGDDYYLEVQSHREQSQQDLNRAIVDIAHDLGIQFVATADSHFVNEEDLELHTIFIAINRDKDTYEADTTYMDTQIQSEAEAWNLLMSLEESERDIAIRNTSIILDKCNVSMPLSAALIPRMNIPAEYDTQEDYLKHLCNEGWIKRGIYKKDKDTKQQYRDRLLYEYEAISEMGFTGYYLLVHGYANSVTRRGIARGSGGGSLVAYLLNIVDIDPIEYGLYFERFIDVAQLDLLREGVIKREELKIPDFDLDFAPDERDLIVKNIVQEHGQERVAALGQFGYIWAKSAIKDVGRVLGIPFEETNEITKHLDDEEETLDGAMMTNLALKQYQHKYPKLFDYAKKLEGLPRSYGMHPCGKVITVDEVLHYTAVSMKEGEVVLHLDMKDAEALGLVKVDILGLRTIAVMFDTLDMIGKDVEYIRNLDYSDKKVLDVFRGGFTDGIFQMESVGMKQTLLSMQPTCLNDLAAVNALYRPGSMKYIGNFIDRMQGRETFEYLHPDLEAILKSTYGIIVFQEQLIEVGRLAGLRNADLIRQATAKKDIKKLAIVEPELRSGLYKRGWTEKQVDQLMADMLDFAKYSFNRSHSQSYAIIAFICAFLKTYHPLEFMCAWFNSLESHHDKLEVCHKEMKRLRIEINPLDYRNVTPLCKIENGALTYGISLLKHCNRQMAEELSILTAAKSYSRFVDLLVDIKEKTTINTKQLDILIRLGYFNQFGLPPKLLVIANEFAEGKNRYDKKHKEKTKEKRIEALQLYEDEFSEVISLPTPMSTISFEQDIYGFIKSKFPAMEGRVVGVLDIDMKYTPKVKAIVFKTGEIIEFKVKKDKYFGRKDIEAFIAGNTIKIKRMSEREKMRKTDSGWEGTGVNELYLEQCSLVS